MSKEAEAAAFQNADTPVVSGLSLRSAADSSSRARLLAHSWRGARAIPLPRARGEGPVLSRSAPRPISECAAAPAPGSRHTNSAAPRSSPASPRSAWEAALLRHGSPQDDFGAGAWQKRLLLLRTSRGDTRRRAPARVAFARHSRSFSRHSPEAEACAPGLLPPAQDGAPDPPVPRTCSRRRLPGAAGERLVRSLRREERYVPSGRPRLPGRGVQVGEGAALPAALQPVREPPPQSDSQ